MSIIMFLNVHRSVTWLRLYWEVH